MTRRDKINYYLDIAETVLSRGTCLRRLYGAIIVKNDQIISTGYVGAPRGRPTAPIWDIARGRNCRFHGGSGMNCAVPFMRKQTRSSTLPART